MAGHDERTIHRLEAFSDIVMGFCLAEIGLNLVIPNDNAALAAMWPSLSVFAFSFILIATLWWYHHKLFVRYFALNPVTVVMNFTLLAALALGVYFELIAAHFFARGVDPIPSVRLWLGCMAVVYALLPAMYALGIWTRRASLDRETLQWGVKRISSSTLACVSLALLCAALPSLRQVVNATIACIIVGVLLRSLAVPRITAYLLAGR